MFNFLIKVGGAAIGGFIGYVIGKAIITGIERRKGPLKPVWRWVLLIAAVLIGALLMYFLAGLLSDMLGLGGGDRVSEMETAMDGQTLKEVRADKRAIMTGLPGLPRIARKRLVNESSIGTSSEEVEREARLLQGQPRGVVRRAIKGKGGKRAQALRSQLDAA